MDAKEYLIKALNNIRDSGVSFYDILSILAGWHYSTVCESSDTIVENI